jgi:hypothetical protein
MQPTQEIDVHQERCHPSHQRKRGVGESLEFHTCMCLDALDVDDLIILASYVNILKWLKSRLEDEFEMSDLGELQYCLGVEFERDLANRTITMSQRKYIEEVLKRFNMEECKPIGTPLDVNSKLLKLTEEEFQGIQEEMQGIPYKAAVGSLMYAMVGTRPDLAFPVSMVSQFMSRAGPSHWMAVKRIMRYLKGTLDLKLCPRNNLVDKCCKH